MVNGLHANGGSALRDCGCVETSRVAVNTTIGAISKTKISGLEGRGQAVASFLSVISALPVARTYSYRSSTLSLSVCNRGVSHDSAL